MPAVARRRRHPGPCGRPYSFAGLPNYVIKTYGRWASDAALVYFLSEASIASSAALAFVTAT